MTLSKKINQKVLNGNQKGFENRLSGLHQLIFREPGLCEDEVAEKCQRLVTGFKEMEVIDISPFLFLAFLLSLSLQNTDTEVKKPCDGAGQS